MHSCRGSVHNYEELCSRSRLWMLVIAWDQQAPGRSLGFEGIAITASFVGV